MAVTSLIPLFMSVALLSKTALDMTRSVSNRRREDRRVDTYHQPGWGSRIQEYDDSEDFTDHQVRTLYITRSGSPHEESIGVRQSENLTVTERRNQTKFTPFFIRSIWQISTGKKLRGSFFLYTRPS